MSEDITVSKAFKKKEQLEHDIRVLCKKFQDDTLCTVDLVTVTQVGEPVVTVRVTI